MNNFLKVFNPKNNKSKFQPNRPINGWDIRVWNCTPNTGKRGTDHNIGVLESVEWENQTFVNYRYSRIESNPTFCRFAVVPSIPQFGLWRINMQPKTNFRFLFYCESGNQGHREKSCKYSKVLSVLHFWCPCMTLESVNDTEKGLKTYGTLLRSK